MQLNRRAAFSGRLYCGCLLLCLAAGQGLAAPSPLALSGDLGFGFDNNVSNSQDEDPTRDSSFATGAMHAGYTKPFSLYTTMLARGSLQAESYNRFDGLTNGKVVGLVRLLHRPAGGFYMPSFALSASVAYWEFDSRIRDSNEYRFSGFVREQLTTAISARLSLGFSQRESDSRVFDLKGQSLILDLDWQAAPRLTVYGAYQFHQGDVVSSSWLGAPISNHTFIVASRAQVIEADDAYGGLGANEFAYRLDADTNIGNLGFNYALSQDLSLDAQIQSVHTEADGDVRYTRQIGIVSLLARFGK